MCSFFCWTFAEKGVTLEGMVFSFKVAAMSFLETAASLAEQFNPLWILPEWLRNFILAGLKVRCCLA